MSQTPDFGPFDEEPQPPLPPWTGLPYYPGFAMPYGDPRFDPADPLVSGDYAGWWRRSFAVVRRGWRALALVQICIAFPALALLIPAQIYIDMASRDLTASSARGDLEGFDKFLAAAGVSVLAFVVVSLISSVGALTSARLVVTVATGGEARAGRALRSILPRVPALIGWSLLASLICVAAVLACFLPVLYVGAVFVLLVPVVLFERGGGISRCFSLFHTDLGAAVARIATIVGLGIGVSIFFGTLSTVVTAVVRGTAFPDPMVAASTSAVVADSVAGTVLTVLGSLITGVVLPPLIVATYADLRARREPFTTAYLAA